MEIAKKGIADKTAPGTLWKIEITFRHGVETKQHALINVSNAELKKFREDIFFNGMMYPIDPGHWILISPFEIITIDVWKQARRFDAF